MLTEITHGDLFCSERSDGPASEVIHFKFRRLVYNEISRMNAFVNFKGARILGYCLNVMGLEVQKNELHSNVALHRVVLSWTKKNYAWVYNQNPDVAEACLVKGYTFDEPNSRIVRTYPAKGLRRKPLEHYFPVDHTLPQESQKA